jgi:hypothetical protein
MGNRIMFLIGAIAAGVFFAARVQGIDNPWRRITAAIAVAIMLALCLMLFVGDRNKASTK